MSLIDGLILCTLNDTGSRHLLLMCFYKLDREIQEAYDTRTYKENFHDAVLYFKQIEAFAILKTLNIT